MKDLLKPQEPIRSPVEVFIENTLDDIDWKTMSERDIKLIADRAVHPEHRAAVLRLISNNSSVIANGDNAYAIQTFLESAEQEGLLPGGWVDDAHNSKKRTFAHLPRAECRQELTVAATSVTNMPRTWDEATTIVMRSEQLAQAELLGLEAADRLDAFSVKPMAKNTRWLVLSDSVLRGRMNRVDKIRTLSDPSPIYDPSAQIERNALLYMGHLIDEDWNTSMFSLLSRICFDITGLRTRVEAHQEPCRLFLELDDRRCYKRGFIGDPSKRDTWLTSACRDFLAFAALRYAGTPLSKDDVSRVAGQLYGEQAYPPQREQARDLVLSAFKAEVLNNQMAFADYENPFDPIFLTWGQGMPLVSCSERNGLTFMVPSACLV